MLLFFARSQTTCSRPFHSNQVVQASVMMRLMRLMACQLSVCRQGKLRSRLIRTHEGALRPTGTSPSVYRRENLLTVILISRCPPPLDCSLQNIKACEVTCNVHIVPQNVCFVGLPLTEMSRCQERSYDLLFESVTCSVLHHALQLIDRAINQSIRKIFNVSRITNVIARSMET